MPEPLPEKLDYVAVGELIRTLAAAVADTQTRLDLSAAHTAELMSGKQVLRNSEGNPIVDSDGNPRVEDSRVYYGYTVEDGRRVAQQVSMLELGFTPTFYQFVETTIEVRLALRVHYDRQSKEHTLAAAPVEAGYTSSYNYDGTMSSVVKTRLVPIPPPAMLEERVRLLLEQQKLETLEKSQRKAEAEDASSEPEE